MRLLLLIYVSVFTLRALAQQDTTPIPLQLPDEGRVSQIARWLPDEPVGFGRPWQDRKAWRQLLPPAVARKIIAQAVALQNTAFPPWSDSIYNTFYTIGSREAIGNLFTQRAKWLPLLIWAECLENKDRFMPAIEKVMQSYFRQTSWVLPPHDIDKGNISGTKYFPDLVAADIAHNLAQAGYLLNDKLSPATREQLLQQLNKRVFEPVLETLRTHNTRYNWWLSVTNNWNAVCLSGVTGAALAALPDKNRRALFVAVADTYKDNFIAGFDNDGYCSEGLGYYNYGFSRYLFLRENIWQATGGQLDLFEGEKIKRIAAYPLHIALAPNVYPAIGDCKVFATPWAFIGWYNNRVLKMGLAQYDTFGFEPPATNLVEDLLFSFPNSASLSRQSSGKQYDSGYIFFKEAGVLVIPAANNSTFAACIKGGNNAEHHNHNDLGSYTLVYNAKKIVEDPGGPYVYTAKTFSQERYTITCINSYGHPLPLIGGGQQLAGATSVANINQASFKNASYTLGMDISSAYTAGGLLKMQRSFYSERTDGTQSFTVTDTVEFTQPSSFETAIITRAAYKIINDTTIQLDAGGKAIVANIYVTGGAITLRHETITEERPSFERIAITFKEPVRKATVTIRYTPAEKAYHP